MTGKRLADAWAAGGVNKASHRCGARDRSWLVGGLAWGGNRRLPLTSPFTPPLAYTSPTHHVGGRRG